MRARSGGNLKGREYELDNGGTVTEFSTPTGQLTGVAGWNAGPPLQAAAARS